MGQQGGGVGVGVEVVELLLLHLWRIKMLRSSWTPPPPFIVLSQRSEKSNRLGVQGCVTRQGERYSVWLFTRGQSSDFHKESSRLTLVEKTDYKGPLL